MVQVRKIIDTFWKVEYLIFANLSFCNAPFVTVAMKRDNNKANSLKYEYNPIKPKVVVPWPVYCTLVSMGHVFSLMAFRLYPKTNFTCIDPIFE